MAGERVQRTNRQRMPVVTTLAPPTAGERVARTNRQRMLVVTTLAPPTEGETVTRKMTNEYSNMSKPFSERNSVLFTKTYSTVRQVKVRKF